MTKKPTNAVTCGDCYFKAAGLCALSLDAVCPTFRSATRAGELAPPLQPRLVPRPLAAFSAQAATA